MPFLGDYACKVCLQRLSKISLWEGRFLLPTSSRHLGILWLTHFGPLGLQKLFTMYFSLLGH
jgi:hypothetical protein